MAVAPSHTLEHNRSCTATTTVFQACPHKESHRSHNALFRNIIVGFADGLTVPFALTAGLSSLGSSHLVLLAGIAELVSGAVSMGLGAYLAASTERTQYHVEEKRERLEVLEQPDVEQEEIYEIMTAYGLTRERVRPMVEGLILNPDMWVKFMMDFELKLEEPKVNGAWIEALVMGLSYLLGGIIPMIPYIVFKDVNHALFTSIGITIVTLIIFGYIKAWVTGNTWKDCALSATQTLLVGASAAAASYGIVRSIDSVTSSGHNGVDA